MNRDHEAIRKMLVAVLENLEARFPGKNNLGTNAYSLADRWILEALRTKGFTFDEVIALITDPDKCVKVEP
jgi:predicted component of type VI protein secretion system